MAFDVALGQYYESKSLIHKLDPRTKIFLVIMFMIATFVAKDIYAFAFLLGILLFAIIVSRVPLRVIFKGLRGIAIIVIFTAILNIFGQRERAVHLLAGQLFPTHLQLIFTKRA